jgi:hypothetical protein
MTMPENTIAQNLVIFYPCEAPQLKTHSGTVIATQSNPEPAPPSTTSLIDDPTAIVQESVIGAQHY